MFAQVCSSFQPALPEISLQVAAAHPNPAIRGLFCKDFAFSHGAFLLSVFYGSPIGFSEHPLELFTVALLLFVLLWGCSERTPATLLDQVFSAAIKNAGALSPVECGHPSIPVVGRAPTFISSLCGIWHLAGPVCEGPGQDP